MAELRLTPEQASALWPNDFPRPKTKTGRSRLACDMRCVSCNEVVRVPGDGPIPHQKENPTHRRYECIFPTKGTR